MPPSHATRRNLRRHIRIALGSATLGVGLMMPAQAQNTVAVTTTQDSGENSLRGAITTRADQAQQIPQYQIPLAPLEVVIDTNAVGIDPVFELNEELPELRWGTTVNIDNVDTVTIPSSLVAKGTLLWNGEEMWGSSAWNITNGIITGDLTAETKDVALEGGSISYAGGGQINLTNSEVKGNAFTRDEGSITLDNTLLEGDVIANDNSHFSTSNESFLDGTVIANDNATVALDHTFITNDITAYDDAQISITGNSLVGGRHDGAAVGTVTADGGTIDIDHSTIGVNGGTGNVTAVNGGLVNILNQATINGITQANGTDSRIVVDDSTVTDLEARTGGNIEVGTNSAIKGNVFARNAGSYISIGEAIITGDNPIVGTIGSDGNLETGTGYVDALDGGHIDINHGSTVYGNVTSRGEDTAVYIHDRAQVGMRNGQANTGNIEALGGGYIGVSPDSTHNYGQAEILGNAVAEGAGSRIDIHNGSIVGNQFTEDLGATWNVRNGTGNITARDGGMIEVKGHFVTVNQRTYYENSIIRRGVVSTGEGSRIDLKGALIGQELNPGNGEIQPGTGNVTARDGGFINIDRSDDHSALAEQSASRILGNATAVGDGSAINLRASSIGTIIVGPDKLQNETGNVTIFDGGSLNAISATIYGNVRIDGEGSKVLLDDSFIGTFQNDAIQDNTGNIEVTDGGFAQISGGTTVYGDITAMGDNSEIRLGLADVHGNIIASGNSQVDLDGKINLGHGPAYDRSNGNITANDNAEIYLSGNQVSISGNATFNDSSVLRANGGTLMGASGNIINKSLTFNDSSIYAPNMLDRNGFEGDMLTVNQLNISNSAILRPYLGEWFRREDAQRLQEDEHYNPGGWGPYEIAVGEDNATTVLNYGSRTGGEFTIVSPLHLGVIYTSEPTSGTPGTGTDPGLGGDGGIGGIDGSGNGDNGPTGGAGAVRVYLIDNTIDFSPFNGSQNEKIVAEFVSDFVNGYQGTNEGDSLIIKNPDELGRDHGLSETAAELLGRDNITTYLGEAAYYGDLRAFNGMNFGNDSELPGLSQIISLANSVSAQTAQSFWNQLQFIGDINDAMRSNDILNGGSPFPSPPNPFPLNFVSSAHNTRFQLTTLQRVMTPTAERLSAAGNNGTSPDSGVWAAYNGRRQRVKGNSGIGSNSWNSSSNGFSMGYTDSGNRFSWGAAIGHQKANLHFSDAAINGDQKGWNAGLYGSLHRGQLYLNGILSYGRYDNDTYSPLGTSSSKNKATSISLETGKHFAIGKNGSLTPYASAAWTNIKQNETNSGSGIVLSGGSSHLINTELGARYRHHKYDEVGNVKRGLMAGIAWAHQGKDTGLTSSFTIPGAGTSQPIQAAPLANNSLVLQLGAYGHIQKNVIGFAKYQGMFGSGQRINGISAGVGYQF